MDVLLKCNGDPAQMIACLLQVGVLAAFLVALLFSIAALPLLDR